MKDPLADVPTTEMNQEQWNAFRKRWINEWASQLICECGTEEADALEVASIEFENCVGQEGFTARDMRIQEARGH